MRYIYWCRMKGCGARFASFWNKVYHECLAHNRLWSTW